MNYSNFEMIMIDDDAAISLLKTQSSEDPTSIQTRKVCSSIDESTINALRGLEDSKHSTAFLDDLIDTFTRETPELIAQLSDALRARSSGATRHYAHKLKGYCRNLGAVKLAKVSSEIEEGSEPAAPEMIEDLCTDLRIQFHEAAFEISRWRSKR